MPNNQSIILYLTAVVTALMAGLFYAYSCSVNLGLHKLTDEGYIAAMQAINRAIQNPVFFASFMTTPILLPLASYLYYSQPISSTFWVLILATGIYLVGVMGVTALGNIPLNEALDQFNFQGASPETIHHQRVLFEQPWNRLNSIRTVSAIITLLLVLYACVMTTRRA
jgi:uncharacterized membrane protein